MNFHEFLAGRFVGQIPIIKQLDVIGKEIKNGSNYNITLAAESGYGKTALANLFVKWVDPRYLSNAIIYVEDLQYIRPEFRFQILDEAHMIKAPEFLYPIMDRRENTFIITTNEYYDLKEPLRNRTHEFTFTSYSKDELKSICYMSFIKHGFNANDYITEFVVENLGRGIPRRVKLISERVSLFLNQQNLTKASNENIVRAIEEFLNIRDGLTEFDIRYLEFLENAGGLASLNLIVNSVRIPKEVIVKEIEPYLVNRGLIEIGSKGRRLV